MTTLSALTKHEPDATVEWSPDVRELAFELYYTDAGRSVSTLADILSTFPYEIVVPYSTLTYWRRTDLWDIEADKRLAQFAPNRRDRTAHHLTIAAERFAAYLAQVASGAIEPSKPMLVAAKIAFDAAGYGKTPMPDPQPQPPQLPADLRTLTHEQLRDLERNGR